MFQLKEKEDAGWVGTCSCLSALAGADTAYRAQRIELNAGVWALVKSSVRCNWSGCDYVAVMLPSGLWPRPGCQEENWSALKHWELEADWNAHLESDLEIWRMQR